MAVLTMPAAASAAPSVRPARRDEQDEVVETIVRAFAADPAARWMYPEQQSYFRHFPTFVAAFGGGALARGTARISGKHAGAALWLAPGTTPDESRLVPLLAESIAPRLKAEVFALFEELERRHPHEPHWYLPLIGVRPAAQGRGHGSALMRHALRTCDEAGLPAYLEATTARSALLYRRYGFEITGEVRIGSAPPIYPMLRPARDWSGSRLGGTT